MQGGADPCPGLPRLSIQGFATTSSGPPLSPTSPSRAGVPVLADAWILSHKTELSSWEGPRGLRAGLQETRDLLLACLNSFPENAVTVLLPSVSMGATSYSAL